MKLIPCKKPENLDEQQVGNTNTVKGHTFMGRYDADGNYYEQDVCCNRWWKLEDETDDQDEEEVNPYLLTGEELARTEQHRKAGLK